MVTSPCSANSSPWSAAMTTSPDRGDFAEAREQADPEGKRDERDRGFDCRLKPEPMLRERRWPCPAGHSLAGPPGGCRRRVVAPRVCSLVLIAASAARY